jgi:Integrase zinc binding domain
VFGHAGVEKIITILRQYYYWPTLVQDCVRIIAACAPCQRTKTRPLPLPL